MEGYWITNQKVNKEKLKPEKKKRDIKWRPALQILLSSIVIWLIILSLFVPWWTYKRDTFSADSYDDNSSSYGTYHFNVGVTVGMKIFVFHSMGGYDSRVSYVEIHTFDEFEGIFFIILFILVLITLAVAIIIFILLLLKYGNKIRKDATKYFIIPLVLSGVLLIYFIVGLTNTLDTSFIGWDEYSITTMSGEAIARDWWVPYLGWFLFIIIFIIFLVLVLHHFKSVKKQKEEVIESKPAM